MKRKHLALLTLLLSQTTPLWGMEDKENINYQSQRISPNHQHRSEELSLITKLRQKIIEGDKRLKQIQQSKEIENTVLVIGGTGVGKSTLVNYLTGEPLCAKENNDGYYLDSKSPSEIEIGHSGSKTKFPNHWYEATTKTMFYDCPGFDHTNEEDGKEQDILNAFYVNKLFTISKKPKVLFVFSEIQIKERAITFINTLEHLSFLFENSTDLENSISCAFTKQRDIRDVREKLRTLKATKAQGLLDFLAKKESKISLFPHPSIWMNTTSDGVIPPEYRTSILENIKNSGSLSSPPTNVSVSKSSLLLIEDLAKDLNTQISDLIKKEGTQSIINYCNSQIDNHHGSTEALRSNFKKVMSYLNEFQNKLDGLSKRQGRDFSTYLNDLFPTHLNELLPTALLRETLEPFSFLKKVKENITCSVGSWKDSCNILLKKVQDLTESPQSELKHNILTLKGVFVGTSDIVKTLRNYKQNNIKKVDCFGLNKLFIDEDLHSPGMSLNLVAPYWKIIGNKIINLSGHTGSNGANGVLPGEDGQPGGPGGNSGVLYGNGENFEGLTNLRVLTHGGFGGTGGDGQKGQDGEDGLDGNLTIKTIEGNITYYQDKGTEGKPGGTGGRGGQGGIGGHKGYSIIDGYSSWISTSTDGAPGANGNSGQGGQGGKNGKHCIGKYVTGRTVQQRYTAYRTATRQVAYEVTDWEDHSFGQKAFLSVISFGTATIAMNLTTKTRYRTEEYQEPYPAYITVPLPDVWEIELGHQQPDKEYADNGDPGFGLNANGQQNPVPQNILNRQEILPEYKIYCQQKFNPNSGISEFVKSFLTLNQEKN